MYLRLFSSNMKTNWYPDCTILQCAVAEISTLMSIFYGLGPYFSRRKMEKERPVTGEMDGKVFITRQSPHFSSVDKLVEVLSPICTSNCRVNIYNSAKEKV